MKNSKLIFKNKYPDSETIYCFHEYNPNPMNIFGVYIGTTIEIERVTK